jgi:anti-sigma regulatory factor (Ser/Thr protein kinase)
MSYTRVPLDTTPLAVREARAATRTWLRHIGRVAADHPAALVVTELVTNAVLHARGPIALHLWEQVNRIKVGVSDGSQAAAHRRQASETDKSGRGILIVERMSSSWGTDVNDAGKLTWAEIST